MSRPAAKDRIRDARHAVYREHLLDAGEKVFAEHGYDDAKVQAVASLAGVSLATLYGVFETKWDLYRGVHARRTTALHEHVRARGDTPGDLLDRMLHGIAGYIEFHLAHVDYLRMHLREKHVWSTTETLGSPEQVDAWTRGHEMMKKAFALGQEAGIYHRDDAPAVMARTTLAMHQVRLGEWVAGGMVDSPEVVVRAVHRQFVRSFCTLEVAAARLPTLVAARTADKEIP